MLKFKQNDRLPSTISWANHWGLAMPVMALSAVLLGSSCTPSGFQTPRPSLSNAGLNSVFPDQEPSFSGDGRYIVFSSARQGSQAIYLYEVEGNRLVDLPGLNANEVAATMPDISDDGRYIVYVSNALGKSDIFLYDRRSAQVRNISNRIPGDVRNPTISGDGRLIAFESNGLGQWNIEIFDRGEEDLVDEPTPAPRSTPAASTR